MIPVHVREKDVARDWSKRAKTAQAQVAACADDPGCGSSPTGSTTAPKTAHEKRSDLYQKHASLWSELKPALSRWSYDKCWYTEAREVVSDYHVDHFRPKSRVTAHPKKPTNAREEGYWWLAFDWRNYRLAGAWANSPHKVEDGGETVTLGKWDYFPLLNDSFRALGPGDDHEQEQALLLDPVKAGDAALVTFNETGRAKSAVPNGPTESRVDLAVEILGLDAPRLREERQRKWGEVSRVLDSLQRMANLPDDARSPHWQKEQEERLVDLAKLTAPDGEFCGAARACVRALAHHLSDLLPPLDGSILAEPERWRPPEAKKTLPSKKGSPLPAAAKKAKRAKGQRRRVRAKKAGRRPGK